MKTFRVELQNHSGLSEVKASGLSRKEADTLQKELDERRRSDNGGNLNGQWAEVLLEEKLG